MRKVSIRMDLIDIVHSCVVQEERDLGESIKGNEKAMEKLNIIPNLLRNSVPGFPRIQDRPCRDVDADHAGK